MGAPSDGTKGKAGQGVAGNPPPARPRVRNVKTQTLAHVRLEMGKVYSEMRRQTLAPELGTKLVYVLTAIAKLHDASELEGRIMELERRLNAAGSNPQA